MNNPNPYRINDLTDEIQREMELKKFKIEQAEETKRQATKEKEETKRIKVAKHEYFPHCVAIAAAGVIGLASVWFKGCAAQQQLPQQCEESSDVIDVTTSAKHCPNGGFLHTETLSDKYVLVTCKCPGHPVEAPKEVK